MLHFTSELEDRHSQLRTELEICEIGGLFLLVHSEKAIADEHLKRLVVEMPDYFNFTYEANDNQCNFPEIFKSAYDQMGRRSNIFHVVGLGSLSSKCALRFIEHLQYARESFQAKPYSIVFWITPELEQEFFFKAPDFHHWVFGTYDFSKLSFQDGISSEEIKGDEVTNEINKYLQQAVWQYNNWNEVRDQGYGFIIEVMERADLASQYVESYATDVNGQTVTLDNFLSQFISDKSKNFMTLLGDFGTGKTSFAIHYFIEAAKNYLADKNTSRIPIFISLKDYPGKLNIEDFIINDFFKKLSIDINFESFKELALQGKFLFIIDGFDETQSLADEDITISNFDELFKLTFDNIILRPARSYRTTNKVFLTCRTHYFFNEIHAKEVLQAKRTILSKNYLSLESVEIIKIELKTFNFEQVESFIGNIVSDDALKTDIINKISTIYNLKELVSRPLLLDMIVKSLSYISESQDLNPYSLYKTYTDLWIMRDDWRSEMTTSGKRKFMWDLAIKMYKNNSMQIHYTQLEKPSHEYLKYNYEQRDEDAYLYETLTCSFLDRDKNGNYRFMHRSFVELFLAELFYQTIVSRVAINIEYNDLSNETKFFLKYIISENKSRLQGLNLSNFDLRSIDLQDANLRHTNLSSSDLTSANLRGAHLDNSNLNYSVLEGTDFTGASLTKTSLEKAQSQNANFSYCRGGGEPANTTSFYSADLRSANFQEASMDGVDFTCANLANAQLSGGNFCGANFQKATLGGVVCNQAKLVRANFFDCDLKNVIINRTEANSAYFINCIMKWAYLKDSNFAHAKINNAILYNSQFKRINVDCADLTGADLRQVKCDDDSLDNVPLEDVTFS